MGDPRTPEEEQPYYSVYVRNLPFIITCALCARALRQGRPALAARVAARAPTRWGAMRARARAPRRRAEDLRSQFCIYGDLKDVYLPKDYYTGRLRGFAYVQFLSLDDAKEAIRKEDGVVVEGRRLQVTWAQGDRKTGREMAAREVGGPPQRCGALAPPCTSTRAPCCEDAQHGLTSAATAAARRAQAAAARSRLRRPQAKPIR